MRRVPVANRLPGWPRDIANAVNALIGQFGNLADYADDTAAAAGGIEIGQLYRTGSTIKVRVS